LKDRLGGEKAGWICDEINKEQDSFMLAIPIQGQAIV
jgi:hypothetical protein